MDVCQDYNHMLFEEMMALTSPAIVSETKEVVVESMLVSTQSHPIMGDLRDVMDSLRAFMESSGGEYANGVEDGMQRAADMIETILKRHEEK